MRAGNAVYIDALNELKAKAGDNVKVEIPPRNVLLASFLLFILPLIALMSGFFIGGVVWSFLFLFITYLLIFIYDRMFHFVSVKSRIVEVL